MLKKCSERETIHEICGYSLCVKYPYKEDQMYEFRGENAGGQFIGHSQSLGKELKQKIRKANAEMIYGKKELGQFEKAKKCPFCEDDIKRLKIDQLGKI